MPNSTRVSAPRERDAEPPTRATPLVLVENEETVGGRYDDWLDVTGERYHFPNQYRSKVIEGRPFVYYRGVRRARGRRGQPEYFGAGTIGAVYLDPNVPESAPRRSWKWYAEIAEYQPFSHPVPAKTGDGYIERIAKNLWGVGVRDLPQDTFARILQLAGQTPWQEWINDRELPGMPPLAEVEPVMVSDDLLAVSHGRERGNRQGGGPRRSRYSRAIGERAEAAVLKHLSRALPSRLAETLAWPAHDNESPGWDIQYRDETGTLIAVEVKGTSGPKLPNVEITENEWRAAREHRKAYWLFVVANCLTRTPRIKPLQDPYSLYEAGELVATPILWRLDRPRK